MKKFLLLFSIILLITGCSKTKTIKQTEVYIKEVNYIHDTLNLSYRIESTKFPASLKMGLDYKVEVLKNKKWSELKDLQISFVEIILTEELPYLLNIPLVQLKDYNFLENNSYRIVQNASIDNKEYIIYNDFKFENNKIIFNDNSVELIKTKK